MLLVRCTTLIISILIFSQNISYTFAAPAKNSVKSSKKKKKQSAQKLYRIAQKYFEAGKYQKAADSYIMILRLYPKHKQSKLQLAKSFYALRKKNRALDLFKSIDPASLDPESRAEYGLLLYESEKYEAAISQFKKVPKGHPTADLAGYYGAVSAVKIKKYNLAKDFIKQAVVLPDELSESRRLYRDHINKMIAKIQNEMIKDKVIQPSPPPKAPRVPAYKKASMKPQKQNKTPSRKRQRFTEKPTEGKVNIIYQDQSPEYGPTNRQAGSNLITRGSFTTSQQTKKFIKKIPINLGVAFTGALESSSPKGYLEYIPTIEKNQDLKNHFYSKMTNSINAGEITLDAWSEWQFRSSSWLGISGQHFHVLTNQEENKSLSNSSANIYLGHRQKTRKFRAQVGGHIIDDNISSSKYGLTNQTFNGSMKVLPKTFILLKINAQQFYYDKKIDGPGNSLYAGLGLRYQPLPWLAAEATGRLQIMQDFRIHQSNTDTVEIAFDEKSTLGSIKLIFLYKDWLKFTYQYSQDTRKWTDTFKSVSEDASEYLFKIRPDIVVEQVILAQVNYPFSGK